MERNDIAAAMRAVCETATDAGMTESEIVAMAKRVARECTEARTQAAAARLYGARKGES